MKNYQITFRDQNGNDSGVYGAFGPNALEALEASLEAGYHPGSGFQGIAIIQNGPYAVVETVVIL